MNPLVSIIIPVYNVEPYLRESLDSAINQTYQNLEIIVIDDGSTDGSGSICDEYRNDPRVQVIHQENRGLSAARNVGLDLMTGDYVAFLDSDDAFLPDVIQTMVESIKETDAAFVVCGFNTITTENELHNTENRLVYSFQPKEEKILSAEEAFKWMFINNPCICVWNKLYQSRLWNELRYPEGQVYEDIGVIVRILAKADYVSAIPQIGVLHRKRIGSITTSLSIKSIEDNLIAVNDLEDFVKENKPEWLNQSEMQQLQGINISNITLGFSEMILTVGKSGEREQLRLRILNKWQDIDKGNRYRALYYCFKYIPSLVLPLRACIAKCKHIIRRRTC